MFLIQYSHTKSLRTIKRGQRFSLQPDRMNLNHQLQQLRTLKDVWAFVIYSIIVTLLFFTEKGGTAPSRNVLL